MISFKALDLAVLLVPQYAVAVSLARDHESENVEDWQEENGDDESADWSEDVQRPDDVEILDFHWVRDVKDVENDERDEDYGTVEGDLVHLPWCFEIMQELEVVKRLLHEFG